jgi:alanine dehydrogenase
VRAFEHATIASRTREHAQLVAAEADAPFPIEPVNAVEDAVRDADVIVTTTSSTEPVLQREWIADGAHINAVGAAVPTARELDSATVADSSLFVDRRESAENEAGDYLIPLRENAIRPGHIRGELGQVLIGAVAGRTSADEITIFKSLGIAVEDLAAAEYAVGRAREEGAGTEVQF